jgi:nitrate/nitrite transporter NarK
MPFSRSCLAQLALSDLLEFPAHIWCACVIFAWSTLSTIQASVQNFGGLCALRLLLGAAEAMYAGAPFYLSFFYARDKVGFRQGLFLSGSALANAYGGALGYAILLIKSRIAAWRILFLIEGLPTLIMVVVAFLFLPDSLAAAKFLNKREKEVAIYCVQRGQVVDVDHHEGIRWKELISGLTDWRSEFLPWTVCLPGPAPY